MTKVNVKFFGRRWTQINADKTIKKHVSYRIFKAFFLTSWRPGVGLLVRRIPAASESSGNFQIRGSAVSLPPAGHGLNSIFRPLVPSTGAIPGLMSFKRLKSLPSARTHRQRRDPVSCDPGAGSPIPPQYDACWPARNCQVATGERPFPDQSRAHARAAGYVCY